MVEYSTFRANDGHVKDSRLQNTCSLNIQFIDILERMFDYLKSFVVIVYNFIYRQALNEANAIANEMLSYTTNTLKVRNLIKQEFANTLAFSWNFCKGGCLQCFKKTNKA